MRTFIAVAIGLLTVLPAFGEMYRCVDEKGKQVISDTSCPSRSTDVRRKAPVQPQTQTHVPAPTMKQEPTPSKDEDLFRKFRRPQEATPSPLSTPSIQYVEKKANGWQYREVVSIPEIERVQIFCDLDRMQQQTGDAKGAYGVVAQNHRLPVDAINEIAFEGALLKWWVLGRCKTEPSASRTSAAGEKQTSTNPASPIIILLGLMGGYFLPWIVASRRTHHQRKAIAMLNFLLGWTVLGWIIALVWACTEVRPLQTTTSP